jgi:drug/metabolite transporter (DMT)-like permease
MTVTLAHFGFCASGVLSALLLNYGSLHGLSREETLLQILPSFIGPSFCAVVLFKKTDERRFDWRFIVITACDMIGMLLMVIGIKNAGSALFFVTFSWITVFAALWKKIFLGKDQTCYQWVAIMILTFGLCINSVGSTQAFGDDVLFGLVASTGSAIIYSVYYIFCDILGNLPDAPPPEALAAFDGLSGTVIICIYILVVDGPRWQAWVLEPMAKEGGDYTTLVLNGSLMAMSYLVHQLGFFYIAKYR